jgi:hypothetical protein
VIVGFDVVSSARLNPDLLGPPERGLRPRGHQFVPLGISRVIRPGVRAVSWLIGVYALVCGTLLLDVGSEPYTSGWQV